MSDIIHIKDAICEDGNISIKSRNKLIFIAVLFAAFAVAIFSIQLSNDNVLRYVLFLLAIILAAFGVVGAAKPNKCIYYKPTGEEVKEHVFYFDVADKKVVRKAISLGEFDILKLMTAKGQTNMMAVVYATPSLSYLASQMHTYIPHEYIPIEEVIIGTSLQES